MSPPTLDYELHIFDVVGRRDKRFGGRFGSFGEALHAGHFCIAAGEAHSFKIMRELFNSANPPKERWEPK